MDERSGLLEIYIARDGSYLGANDAASTLLGYEAGELRSLPFGALSGTDPEAALQVWRAFIDDGLVIAPHANVLLRSKGGGELPVRFLGAEAQDDDSWVSRYWLATDGPVTTDQPFLLQTLHAQWRDIERRIKAASGAVERAELETQLAEVKALYQVEQRRRA